MTRLGGDVYTSRNALPDQEGILMTDNEFIDDLGFEEMTETKFDNERARLAKTFYMTYGVLAFDEIDDLIRGNKVRTDDLVQAWINLQTLAPYIQREVRPHKPKRPQVSQAEGRESGSSFFRP